MTKRRDRKHSQITKAGLAAIGIEGGESDRNRRKRQARCLQTRRYFESQLAGLRIYADNKVGAAVRAVMRVPNAQSRVPAKPKYRSKKHKRLKWSGGELLPVWIREEMSGTKLTKEDFLIR